MGNGASLHDVMNAVSSHLDAALSAPSAAAPADELEAFARHDPLLSDLRKQYSDAREHHRRAVKEYGPKDGMTELAMMMEDSAWCAMQTRYMELRGDRIMMKKVQETMEERRIEEERAVKAEREKEALGVWKFMQFIAQLQKRREQGSLLMWLYILVFMNPRPMFREQMGYNFNRLAA